MARFAHTPRPTSSPWGDIYEAYEWLPGLWFVSTASHGGILLSPQRQDALPEALRLSEPIYEEDCDWSLPVLAFRDEFEAESNRPVSWLQLADDTVRCWHPDRYAAFTGEPVPESESPVLRRRKAYCEAIGKSCVTAASGDWADWVPKGRTGVVAYEVEAVDHLGNARYRGEPRYALVDKAHYGARGAVFVLDDHRHEIIDRPEEFRPTKRIG